jgi:hypothetical protein
MKNPWKDVRKCVPYDHKANLSGVWSTWESTMLRRFVIPSNGKSTIAARTAFRTCSTSLVRLCLSLTTSTRIMFSRNIMLSCKETIVRKLYKFYLENFTKVLTQITVRRGPSRIQYNGVRLYPNQQLRLPFCKAVKTAQTAWTVEEDFRELLFNFLLL